MLDLKPQNVLPQVDTIPQAPEMKLADHSRVVTEHSSSASACLLARLFLVAAADYALFPVCPLRAD
jgi:hypothetical protein